MQQKANCSPVFLSSSLIIHSSPLLITFSIPSHAHLFTSHSSALKSTLQMHVNTSSYQSFFLHKYNFSKYQNYLTLPYRTDIIIFFITDTFHHLETWFTLGRSTNARNKRNRLFSDAQTYFSLFLNSI